MHGRKFKVGDRVELRLDNVAANNNLEDVYTVSQLLPAEANTWRYRVKRVGDNQERAVSEYQLIKLATAPAVRSEDEVQEELRRRRR